VVRVSSLFKMILLFISMLSAASAGDNSRGETGKGENNPHFRARLISAAMKDGQWLAGLTLDLDEGFKTYWRDPGEAGLAPRFDWSGSDNVAHVEILWPAPLRFSEGNSVSNGYQGGVTWPLRVTPRIASKPVILRLALDFGLCKEQCIPARATLQHLLQDDASAQTLIDEALRRVPQPCLEPCSFIKRVGVRADSTKPSFQLTLNQPAVVQAVFVEGPPDFVLTLSNRQGDAVDVEVESWPGQRDSFPATSLMNVPFRFTFVMQDQAVETTRKLTLDVAPWSR
jgi:DsbC/DsbD-like thiol-disulfide interchange protein